MDSKLSRRELLQTGVCLGALAMTGTDAAAAAEGAARPREPFGYCLNMATIRGQDLPLDREIAIASQAGYQGVEPWTHNLQRFVDGGGSLADLKKRIADSGLSVESAIGFAPWAVDDDAQRAQALEQLRREMDLLARIGGKRIAAPPAGLNRTAGVDLRKVAERYRVVLELGRTMDIVPQLEIWGASLTLSRLGDAALVAIEAAHADACLLLDAYHLYKGGNDFLGLKQLNGAAMHVFHLNDYPADPPRETIDDSYRVYPGDGVCPLGDVLRTLHATGFRGMLSLELFNRELWKQDPLEVARTGLAKMKTVVQKAMA
jgi:sugar phosphate isomerase/epimerase